MADSSKVDFEPFRTMLLIPVTTITSSDGDYLRLEQLFTPAAVKIRGWNHPVNPMKLEIIYSKGKLN
jgi:hypothetical protein